MVVVDFCVISVSGLLYFIFDCRYLEVAVAILTVEFKSLSLGIQENSYYKAIVGTRLHLS